MGRREREVTQKTSGPFRRLYLKIGCEAFFRLYKRRDGSVKLTQFEKQHTNHEVSKPVYLQDIAKVTAEHEELIETLMLGCCKPKQISKALKSRCDLVVDPQQVRYRMKNLSGPNTDNEKLCHLLTQIRDDGGSVNCLEDNLGEVKALIISTAKMKEAFWDSNPSVCNVDTTFNFEVAGYKLNAVLYLNTVTGKGEVAQFGLFADETDETYEFCLSVFKHSCQHEPAVFIID